MNDLISSVIYVTLVITYAFALSSLLLLLIVYIGYSRRKCRIFRKHTTCLLVIAHPDDETMFFAPTLLRLSKCGARTFVLCVTTGNSEGLGEVRKMELARAVQHLGLNSGDVTILDMDGYKDGHDVEWSESERLARLIFKMAASIDTDVIITFDRHGISGHPNHIGCWKAVRYLVMRGCLPPHVKVFTLESVNVFRKFSSILDTGLSWIRGSIFVVANPWPVWRAMREHKSQLVWFRYLYMTFSRYVIFNTLRVLEKK